MAETTVHTQTVLVDGDGTTYYAVDGKLESITIPAGPVAAEIDRLRERVAALEAARNQWRHAFQKADFYIGCTIEDKELFAWKEYDAAKQALYAATSEGGQ